MAKSGSVASYANLNLGWIGITQRVLHRPARRASTDQHGGQAQTVSAAFWPLSAQVVLCQNIGQTYTTARTV